MFHIPRYFSGSVSSSTGRPVSGRVQYSGPVPQWSNSPLCRASSMPEREYTAIAAAAARRAAPAPTSTRC
jgi:hypothetical protein